VQVVQAEELLISLVCLIKTMAQEGQGAIASALQAAARHLHGTFKHIPMQVKLYVRPGHVDHNNHISILLSCTGLWETTAMHHCLLQ